MLAITATVAEVIQILRFLCRRFSPDTVRPNVGTKYCIKKQMAAGNGVAVVANVATTKTMPILSALLDHPALVNWT